MENNWLSDQEVAKTLGLSEEEVSEKVKVPVLSNGEEEKEDEALEERKPVEVYKAEFQPFEKNSEEDNVKTDFGLLNDIPMEIRVVLARVNKTIEEISSMETGDIVSTERLAGEPVDVVVGKQIIAKGEIVIIEDKFGVFITEIVSPDERIKGAAKLGRKN